VDVFRSDPVRDDRARVVALHIEVHALLGAGTHEIRHEIHPPARAHEAHVGIGVFALDDDVVVEEDVAVKGEVPERCEPRWRVNQLIADDQRHLGYIA
jgi:hypothetical protein